MQGGWQPPGGGSGYRGPPGPGYGAPPPGYAPQQQQPNPYGYPGQQQPPPMQYGDYEFNAMENSIIDKTASRAKLWGTIPIVIGVLQCMSSCGAAANASLMGQLPAGVIAIIVGVSFLGVGNSLKSVVNTQGNDVAHMMQAMQKLSSAFMVQIVCTVIGVVLVALILVLVMFIFVAAAASR